MRCNWDQFWMDLATIYATRSTCDRKHVGCVIVRDNKCLVSGYNGSLPGKNHCDDVGHLYLEGETGCKRTVHAEMNAIISAAKEGISINGSVAYVTCKPCLSCAKALYSAGVDKVYFKEDYRNDHSDILLKGFMVKLN